ncbi:MAG: glycoside hydrolase family 2 protein, partial [Oscillospiraceae bacterium]|nr:glycoside hydrolase family 2 protein [Oscillospiraceae bacterium]
MRRLVNLNPGWKFTGRDGVAVDVNVPHTWNNIDGQDGGNDYYRGVCNYTRSFDIPAYDAKTELVYLQFQGVNSSCTVNLNGTQICSHDGGYSTFRVDIT